MTTTQTGTVTKPHAVVSFSGGMDSATLLIDCALEAKRRGRSVAAFSFYYGSKHNNAEIEMATRFIGNYRSEYDIRHSVIDVSVMASHLRSNLLQSGGPIPEGHYAASNMAQTVVPGRNTIFASILLGIAQSLEADYVALGVHSGDHVIYPDCRPVWVQGMRSVFDAASEGSVRLLCPYLYGDKSTILRRGYEIGVDYSLTRTCYNADASKACGKCGSCQERLEAFRLIGKDDPIDYECREILPKASE